MTSIDVPKLPAPIALRRQRRGSRPAAEVRVPVEPVPISISASTVARRSGSSNRRRRLALAIVISLAGHVSGFAMLAITHQPRVLSPVPVQAGMASYDSLAASASIASRAECQPAIEIDAECEVPADAVMVEAMVETMHELLEAKAMEITRADDGHLHRLAKVEVPLPRVTLESVRPPRRKQTTSWPKHDPPVREPVVERQPAREPSVESAASLASLPSTASQGAESAVPSIDFNPAPQYPAEALAKRQTGRVVVRVSLTADGTVLEASVYRSSGVESLDRAAVAAVGRWRFSPTSSPRAALREIAVPVSFVLADARL